AYSISACEDEAVTLFSGNVYDCNLVAGGAETVAITVTPDVNASLNADIQLSYTLVEDGFLYFEAVGTGFGPGEYFVVFTYGGVSVDQLVTVSQNAPQAAAIELPGNLTFTVPACETQLDATFQVRVSDDCDDPIAAPAITIGGTPVDVIADLGNGLFEVSTVITAANDGDFIVASYTDGDGQATTVDGILTVNDQPDTFQPIIVYPSQNINVTLDPCGPSMAEVVFQASAYDNCSDVTPVVTVSGGANVAPAGGGYIVTAPANGTYTVTVEATDAAGNASSESFDIVVSQDEAPQPSLACND
ncbi:Ig-like domain-containing protein, partial [Phaeodactylibacter luteus]|uniref:hypothetical protein n=1 Tax=Phaeodactylibacter luteus TaxID=1564516 RepID=UPI0014782108